MGLFFRCNRLWFLLFCNATLTRLDFFLSRLIDFSPVFAANKCNSGDFEFASVSSVLVSVAVLDLLPPLDGLGKDDFDLDFIGFSIPSNVSFTIVSFSILVAAVLDLLPPLVHLGNNDFDDE